MSHFLSGMCVLASAYCQTHGEPASGGVLIVFAVVVYLLGD